MEKLTRVVVRGRSPTFMNTHSDFYTKKFDLMHGTHMTLNALFSWLYTH